MSTGAKRPRKGDSESPDHVNILKNKESPVLSIRLQNDPPDLDISSPELLQQLIHPISSKTFDQLIFRKKALHITGGTVSRVHTIIDEMQQLSPEHILTETSSDNVFCWIRQLEGRIQSLEMADPQHAIVLHAAGHATYCRAQPSIEQPMVANLLRGTGLGCGQYDPSGESSVVLGRGEVEVFMGTAKHTTDWHYDFQENFTLQLSGTKRWLLQQGTVKYPLRACTPHYQSPEAVESQLKAAHLSNNGENNKFHFGKPKTGETAVGNVEEVTLHPGDFLYFPAGMWHQVQTVDPGVSINISLMATNYAIITCQALQHLLLQDDEWRETIVTNKSDSVDGGVLPILQRLLEKLPDKIAQFTHQGGAEAILPPILRNAPSFQASRQDDMWTNVKDEDENDDDDDGREEDHDSAMHPAETNSNSNDTVLGTDVLHAMDFERPKDCFKFLQPPQVPSRLCLNPLAFVRPVRDVTAYYNSKDDYKNLYIVNINYAGNEMHESAVRFVVYDVRNPVENIPPSPESPREEFYLYHGLYCWTPRLIAG